MFEIISYIIVFVVGYLLAYNRPVPTNPKDDETIAELRKEIGYYKDLCQWHVEEKEKLKREHYIDE